VDAVVLALCSAALYGAMTVALRVALVGSRASAEFAALCTVLPAFAVALAAAVVRGGWDVAGLLPFVAAGVLGPGLSQTLFTLGVREAGPARASVMVGAAPLFSVAIALVLLDEPVVAGVLAGAVLIVAGGVLLAVERDRPLHVRRIGLVFALGSAFVFAARDNLVRWVAIDSDVTPELAAATTLGTGALVIGCWVLAARRPASLAPVRRFVAPGVFFGLSYVCIFESFYRGRVTVVSPLVATESLWGVGLSALFLRNVEVVGARLVLGAVAIVAGGILIGVFR
jgi:drug/metabolite transporter (DMT)-like permease